MAEPISVCAHPIWLVARTESTLTSLYYCFFLADVDSFGELVILQRTPRDRQGIEDIEAGLKLFLKEAIDSRVGDVYWGTFAVTTSHGVRYYIAWRRTENRFFLAVLLDIFDIYIDTAVDLFTFSGVTTANHIVFKAIIWFVAD